MGSVSTPTSWAAEVLAELDAYMELVIDEGYLDAADAFEQLHKLADTICELRLQPGMKVRLIEAAKVAYRANDSGEHIDEFGECVGIVDGPMDYTGPSCQIQSLGPEVDVRWQPSNLRYSYAPNHLEIVE